jgi:hypothetical protein
MAPRLPPRASRTLQPPAPISGTLQLGTMLHALQWPMAIEDIARASQSPADVASQLATLTAAGVVRASLGAADVYERAPALRAVASLDTPFRCAATHLIIDPLPTHARARAPAPQEPCAIAGALPPCLGAMRTLVDMRLTVAVAEGDELELSGVEPSTAHRVRVQLYPRSAPALAQAATAQAMLDMFNPSTPTTHLIILTPLPHDYRFLANALTPRGHVVHICASLPEVLAVLEQAAAASVSQ